MGGDERERKGMGRKGRESKETTPNGRGWEGEEKGK